MVNPTHHAVTGSIPCVGVMCELCATVNVEVKGWPGDTSHMFKVEIQLNLRENKKENGDGK